MERSQAEHLQGGKGPSTKWRRSGEDGGQKRGLERFSNHGCSVYNDARPREGWAKPSYVSDASLPLPQERAAQPTAPSGHCPG